MKPTKKAWLFSLALISLSANAQEELVWEHSYGLKENLKNNAETYVSNPIVEDVQEFSGNVEDNRKGVKDVQQGVETVREVSGHVQNAGGYMADAKDGIAEMQEAFQSIQGKVGGGFPNIDGAAIAAAIVSTINKVTIHIAKTELFDLRLLMKKELAKLEQEAINNGAATYIEKIIGHKIEKEKRRLREQIAASPIMCDQLANSMLGRNAGCLSQDLARNPTNTVSYAAYVQGNESARNIEAKKLLDRIESTHPSLFGLSSSVATGAASQSEETENSESEGSVSDSYSINATPLMSSASPYMALDIESHKAMKDLISLIVPDPATRPMATNLSLLTDVDMNLLLSKEARRALGQQSLMLILGLRSSEFALTNGQALDPTSRMLDIERSVSSGLTESAIYKISTGETSTPTRLYRTRVLSMLNELDVQVEEFKGQLRAEGMTATRLASLATKQKP